MLYHIIDNLEAVCENLDGARALLNKLMVQGIDPKIPYHTMTDEDRTTPRICVARSIENCVSSIGVIGDFRRCCNANPDAKSYENDNEAYPVIILQFAESDFVTPTNEQVPDCKDSGELWLTSRAVPVCGQIKWLGAYSVKYETTDTEFIRCTAVDFLPDVKNYHHPWLDGLGHPLDCSDMGSDLWPNQEDLDQFLYAMHAPDRLVYAMPTMPFDGYMNCVDARADPGQAPFRANIKYLHGYTGWRDKNLYRIFEDDRVEYGHRILRVTNLYGMGWALTDLAGEKIITWFHNMDRIADMRLVAPLQIE